MQTALNIAIALALLFVVIVLGMELVWSRAMPTLALASSTVP